MNAIEEEGYGLEPAESAPRPAVAPQAPPVSATPAPDEAPTHSTMANVAYDRRMQRQASEAAAMGDATREAYRTPLLMIAIGLGCMCAITYFAEGGLAVAAYLLGYVGSVPIGVAIYLLCCWIWIGFNEPIHLIILNLVGIYAVTNLVETSIGFVPVLGLLAWLIAMGTYVWLLSQRLEIELGEAIIVGLLTFLAKRFIAAAIVTAAM